MSDLEMTWYHTKEEEVEAKIEEELTKKLIRENPGLKLTHFNKNKVNIYRQLFLYALIENNKYSINRFLVFNGRDKISMSEVMFINKEKPQAELFPSHFYHIVWINYYGKFKNYTIKCSGNTYTLSNFKVNGQTVRFESEIVKYA